MLCPIAVDRNAYITKRRAAGFVCFGFVVYVVTYGNADSWMFLMPDDSHPPTYAHTHAVGLTLELLHAHQGSIGSDPRESLSTLPTGLTCRSTTLAAMAVSANLQPRPAPPHTRLRRPQSKFSRRPIDMVSNRCNRNRRRCHQEARAWCPRGRGCNPCTIRW